MIGKISNFLLDGPARRILGGSARGGLIGGVIGLAGGIATLAFATTGLGLGASIVLVSSATVLGGTVGGVIGGYLEYQWEVKRRVAGLELPTMTISRIRDEEGNVIFRLSNFKICDSEIIANGLQGEEAHDFSLDPAYSVDIRLKRDDITLAELDYGDLTDNPDFELVVSEIVEGGGLRGVEDEGIQARVRETLQIMPKFLGDRLYHPSDVATEVIGEATTTFSGVLGGPVGGFIDRSYDAVRSFFSGKVVRLSVDQNRAPSPKLETEEFLAEIADVAIATGKYRELFANHEKVLRSSHDKALKLALEKTTREKEALGGLGKFSKVAAPVSLILTVGLVGLAIASVFPPISSAIALLVFAGFAVVTGIFSLFTGYFAYKEISLSRRIADIEAKQVSSAQELERRFQGLEATRENIQELVDHQGRELNLANKHLGDSCMVILTRWVNSPQASSCQTINLAGNNLTDKEMARFFHALGSNHNVSKLDVKGNPLTAASLEVLREALVNNLALTVVDYDKTKITNELHIELQKQLLINRYLQSDLTETDRAKMSKYFGSQEEFERAVVAKISGVKNIGALRDFQIRPAMPQLGAAIVQRQIDLVFAEARPRDFNLLVDYIGLYRQAEEHKLLHKINHSDVLSLVRASMFDEKGNFHFASNPGIQKLRSMDEPYRTDMLMHCFDLSTDEHVHGLANITSQLIGFPGIFDRKQDTKALKSLRVFLSEIFYPKEDEQITFEDAVYLLKEIKKGATTEEAVKIDEILRAVMPLDMTDQFGDCLQNYAGVDDGRQLAFRNYLESNLDLVEFSFDEVKVLGEDGRRKNITVSSGAKKLIEDTILRNKLHKALGGEFSDFLAVFSGVPGEDAQQIFAALIALKIDNKKIASLVGDDAKTNFSQLKELPVLHRSLLLAMPLYTGQDMPIDREVMGFATLLSGLIEISKENGDVLDKAIKEQLFDRWTDLTFAQGYNNCSSIVHELAKKHPDLAEKIDLAYKTAIIEYLKTNYPFLISGTNLAPSIEDLSRLEREITGYLSDFTDYASFMSSDIPESAKTVIKRGCIVNQLEKADDSLAGFIKIFKGVSIDMCRDILEKYSKHAILSMIVKDLGGVKELTCNELRGLDHEHRVALLKSCFSLADEPEKAHKKAVLISRLLKIDGLFDGESRSVSRELQDINYQIYWAIAPGSWRKTDRPYYTFDELVRELDSIVGRIPEGDQNLAGIKNQINELLTAARVEAGTEEAPVELQAEDRLESGHN